MNLNVVVSDPAELSKGQQMISSCTGAIFTSLFATPLDVIKIRLQAQQKDFMNNKCYVYCNGLMDHLCPKQCGNLNPHQHTHGVPSKPDWFVNPRIPAFNGFWVSSSSGTRRMSQMALSGTMDALYKIPKHEGITSLWSGLPPTLVMAVPATVVYFATYEHIKAKLIRNLGVNKDTMPVYVPMLSGATARVGAATLVSPFELIRTKMQSKKLTYAEIRQAVRSLLAREGVLGLWKGLGPTILRDVPFSALYWGNYEYFKRRFKTDKLSVFWFSFLCGAGSGTIAAVITLPFDVVKTHRQIELGAELFSNGNQVQAVKAASTLATLRKLYMFQGVTALFAGLVPRIVKVAPACAIMISTYEVSKVYFKKYNQEKARRKIES